MFRNFCQKLILILPVATLLSGCILPGWNDLPNASDRDADRDESRNQRDDGDETDRRDDPEPTLTFLDASGVAELSMTAITRVPNSFEVANLTGSVDLETGVITVTDGTESWTFAAESVSQPQPTMEGFIFENATDGDYDSLREFAVQSMDGGSFRISSGIIGMATPADLMPDGGTATFNGVASISVNQPGNLSLGGDADAEVSIDFGNDTVDVMMTDFVPPAVSPGTTPPSDMTLTGMTIDGTGFSGGTLSGTDTSAVGANSIFLSEGQFFGVNADGDGPSQVGGVFSLYGDDGSIDGNFRAN